MSTETLTDPQATRAALEALLPVLEKPLRNFLFGLLHNHQSAEDALQDTLLKALLALEKGIGHLPPAEPKPITHWLYRIARNTAIDIVRHRDRITWIPLSCFTDDRGIGAGLPFLESTQGSLEPSERAALSACLSTGYNGATFEDDVALRELIKQAFEQLPPDYARCLQLFVFDDCSCPEIAEQLHITHDAVKTRLYRARKRLAAFYNAN